MAYPGGMTVDTGGGSGTTILRSEMSLVLFGGLASMEAGAVHAAAAGIHAEHRQLAQLFIVIAALQLGVGLWAVVRSSRAAAWAVVGVNAAAIAGWLYTRLAGLSWIEGLEVREAPQFADTACALLAAVAVFAAYTGAILPPERRQQRGLVIPAVVLGMFAVWTMLAAGTHVHSHEAEAADGHSHGTEEVADRRARAWHRGSCRRRRRRCRGRRRGRLRRGSLGYGRGSRPHRGGVRGRRRARPHHRPRGGSCRRARRPGVAPPVGPDPAGRPVGCPRRHDRTATPSHEARGRHAGRAPPLRRSRRRHRRGLLVDRRRRHGQRALHQGRSHRGRRPPRPARSRITRLQRRERPAHARRRDVHRQRPPRRRSVAHRAGPAR